jgi:hypothetical protein
MHARKRAQTPTVPAAPHARPPARGPLARPRARTHTHHALTACSWPHPSATSAPSSDCQSPSLSDIHNVTSPRPGVAHLLRPPLPPGPPLPVRPPSTQRPASRETASRSGSRAGGVGPAGRPGQRRSWYAEAEAEKLLAAVSSEWSDDRDRAHSCRSGAAAAVLCPGRPVSPTGRGPRPAGTCSPAPAAWPGPVAAGS